jgi:hypothetical protein
VESVRVGEGGAACGPVGIGRRDRIDPEPRRNGLYGVPVADERFEAFSRRSLYDVHLVVLFVDAIYLPVRPSGPKEGVICAWGITENGHISTSPRRSRTGAIAGAIAHREPR